jgi:diguanylate cyclase (GGDEF)-like protein
MSELISSRQRRIVWIHQVLDNVLYGLATYAIPVLISLVSLFALFAWDSMHHGSRAEQLDIQVLHDETGSLTPPQASQRLREQPKDKYLDSRLSESPYWVRFSARKAANGEAVMIQFPSRHAVEIGCWDAESLMELGRASRQHVHGAMSVAKAGFALAMGPLAEDRQLLCRTRFVGPARFSAVQLSDEEFSRSVKEYHRNSGLLDGGLIILALFVLITAFIIKESDYVLFAAWLLINLRMGAVSAGWDTQWLGLEVPVDWLQKSRALTTSLYYVLTATLFRVLFRDELKKVGFDSLIRVVQWTCIPLLVLSVTLPYKNYLPLLWVTTAFSVGILIFFLVRILVITRSAVAIWYIASLAVTLSASLYEVISAALGIQGLIGTINSVTAALASSLLALLAVAEQMRQEHLQKVDAQAELQHTYEAMPIGLFTLDLQGRFVSANPELNSMLGRKALHAGRDNWPYYFSDTSWIALYEMVTQRQHAELEVQSTCNSPEGDARRYLVKAALAGDKIEGSLQDVTEKSIATEELEFLANHDSLTKAFNRHGIEQVFNGAVSRINGDHPLAMAYLDLDRFKLINDLYGHNAGDDLLKQVCQRVSGMLSGKMCIGRVGGDEFVILLPDTRMSLATAICRGIVDSIDGTPYRVGEKAFHVRGSIGLIEIGPGTSMKEALSTSDRACREAKTGQHKGLVVYERESTAFREHEAEIRLIERLAASDVIEGLFVEMQPIMSLTQPHASLNFEVLLRMRDPEGNLVPVSRVIAAGEQSGRMSAIDRWVLSTTLAWLDQHRARLQNTQFVCMNLSGASWNDEEFMQEVFDLLRRNSHVVSFLCIEITESVALHDLRNTRRFIDKVRSFGAKVALDDFGAGYTSFAYLKELPADLLKIDGSFVVKMNRHPANVSIVEAIVNLARNLGMKTVAEWAEDAATVQTLSELGVDYVQGFVVARPMACEHMLEADSAARFIVDTELLQFVSLLGRTEGDLTNTDLMLPDIQEIPRKIH